MTDKWFNKMLQLLRNMSNNCTLTNIKNESSVNPLDSILSFLIANSR